MSEIHLIVLWENARAVEDRILQDIGRHVGIVATFTQRWPGDPHAGYARFYGAKAALAASKVESCGGGEFRTVIVRDEHPRYGWKKTSRGTEPVNLRMFAMKQRYRKWVGGGHCVHSTNSVAESERDIFLLTGRRPEDWRGNASTQGLVIFPPGSDSVCDPGAAIRTVIEPTLEAAAEIADLCASVFPVRDLRPVQLKVRVPATPYRELVFDARTEEGLPCTVIYRTFGRETMVAAWDFGRAFAKGAPGRSLKPLFFRMDENGERFGIFVQERLPGVTLREAVRRGLSAERAKEIAGNLLSLAEGLAKARICHRDISPDSLLVCADGTLRLAGFDFAVRLRSGREERWLSRHPEVLSAVGGGYRVDAGRWCDRLALARCAALLPDFPGRDGLLADLRTASAEILHRMRLRHKFMLPSFGRLAWSVARNLLRTVRGKPAKGRAVETLLAHAFRLPVRGEDGWTDLPAVFAALNERLRYVVLRNYEMLPDGFDPTLHGDIDLLVDDLPAAVRLLNARKVIRKPWRVHYEISVSGRPVRLDLRHVGDGYYCTAWEKALLTNRRILPCGIYVPSAEDAFHTLTYHALFQKFVIAPDYPAKVAAFAKDAGIGGSSFDEWRGELVRFMRGRGYEVTRPDDRSVKYNEEEIGRAFGRDGRKD